MTHPVKGWTMNKTYSAETIDTMDNKSDGIPANIHRVTRNRSIISNIERISSRFNTGRQSLEVWGRGGSPGS